MAGAEIEYTFGIRAPIWFARGRDNTSKLPVSLDGAVVEPDSATYSLKDRVGNEISAPVATIGGDFIATVTVPSADLPATLAMGEGYFEVWTITLGGVERTSRRSVVLGNIEMHPPVAEFDLVSGEYPDILHDVSGFAEDLQGYMDAAWAYCTRQLAKRGDFPDLLCEPSDIYDWHRQETLERAFRSLFKTQNNDRYFTLWQHHLAEARKEKEGLRFQADRDRDGVPDSLAKEGGGMSVHANLPSRRITRNPRW